MSIFNVIFKDLHQILDHLSNYEYYAVHLHYFDSFAVYFDDYLIKILLTVYIETFFLLKYIQNQDFFSLLQYIILYTRM